MLCSMSDSESWDARYAQGTDRWTLDRAPAVLEQLIATIEGPRRVLVPGAGRGHDAFAWARAGHEVVALDFAPLAIAAMRERAEREQLAVEAVEADVTAPPASIGRFDLIWEQTCLCAIPPESRRPYLEAMRSLLRPGSEARMLALLWNNGREGGPPYDLPVELVESLIAGIFEVDRREPVAEGLSSRSNEILWRLRPS